MNNRELAAAALVAGVSAGESAGWSAGAFGGKPLRCSRAGTPRVERRAAARVAAKRVAAKRAQALFAAAVARREAAKAAGLASVGPGPRSGQAWLRDRGAIMAPREAGLGIFDRMLGYTGLGGFQVRTSRGGAR